MAMSNISNPNSSSVQNEIVSLFFHKTPCDTSKWKLTTYFMEKGEKKFICEKLFVHSSNTTHILKCMGIPPCNHAIFTKGDNL